MSEITNAMVSELARDIARRVGGFDVQIDECLQEARALNFDMTRLRRHLSYISVQLLCTDQRLARIEQRICGP